MENGQGWAYRSLVRPVVELFGNWQRWVDYGLKDTKGTGFSSHLGRGEAFDR